MPLIRRDRSTPPAPAGATPAAGAMTQLVSGDASERWAAARELAADAGAVKALAAAVVDEDAAEVRDAIFTSLVLIRTGEAAEALAQLLRSDVAHLRTGALDALGSMSDVARPFLPGLLADDDADVRLLTCELVRGLEAQDGTDLLCAMLAEEAHANVCGAAVDVLAEMGTPSAAGVLETCAARFAGDAYLTFAIGDAMARVMQRTPRNG